jgi:HEPN domain-containing protein/predicted nucleotidyltransferase
MVTLEEAKTVSREIVRRFQPVSITVFGSVARTGSGNDLDIMVVVDELRSAPDEVSDKIQSYLSHWYRRFSIDPFVVGLAAAQRHLKHGSPFLDTILDEGVLLYMQNAIDEWNNNAAEDLAMARYLFDGDFFRGACYNAQQAVEKMIQARLLSKGWHLEKIYNLRRLIALCEEYRCTLIIPDEDISFLDSIYRSRYPAETGLLPHGEPGRDGALRAIGCAEKVMATK